MIRRKAAALNPHINYQVRQQRFGGIGYQITFRRIRTIVHLGDTIRRAWLRNCRQPVHHTMDAWMTMLQIGGLISDIANMYRT